METHAGYIEWGRNEPSRPTKRNKVAIMYAKEGRSKGMEMQSARPSSLYLPMCMITKKI